VRRVAGSVLALFLLSGCAAPVGDTDVNLHQRVRLADGASYALDGFEMLSSRAGRRTAVPRNPVNDDVIVWVAVSKPQSVVRGADVAMTFTYTDDRNVEVEPPQVASSTNEIPAGSRGRIGKSFHIQGVSQLYRSRHLRVELAVPSYPVITFSGRNP
jgi:hypothetical protein